MHITQAEALWYLPFILPVCLWVAWTDLRLMKILNYAVAVLVVIFMIIGFIALPSDVYLWRLVHLAVILGLGIVLNSAGLIGAGDAKFCAAAAPFIALGDVRLILILLSACLLGGFAAHRIAKHSPLRRLAPHWESWDKGKKFPMGLCLGGTLALYVSLGAIYGA